VAARRFTTSSSHDPTITQKVRQALYDSGNETLVHEIVVDGMRDVEQMTRTGLSDHEKRLLMLEEAQRDRVTESGVWRIVEGKLHGEAVGWMKWGTRAALGGLGAAGLGLLGWVLHLAWKGFTLKQGN
jgi:hypothetical protein